jgi:glucosyl-3-phosphoglycerate synthase
VAGAEHIVLVGLVGVAPQESLSMGAVPARSVRQTIRNLTNGERMRIRARVRVSHTPWHELLALVEEENPDLLIMEWPCALEALAVTSETVLTHPPCNIALVSGPVPETMNRVLVPLRGGPYAEFALRLSLAVASASDAQVTTFHIQPPPSTTGTEQHVARENPDASFRGLARVLASLPDVKKKVLETDDPVREIVSASHNFNLVVMGASSRPDSLSMSLGPVADRVLHESRTAVIVVKTKRSMPSEPESEMAGQTAISVLVDKWFAENTYHADEFADLGQLVELKQKQGLTISLALPALNEEETVGKVIRTVKQALMDEVALLDEVVLIDSDSTDHTREIATDLGIPVFIHQQTLPQYGVRHGKGEALWKSLYATRGDIVLWIDTDIVNIHPRFVYGLIGPLLSSPRVQFVKGFYRRPLKVGNKIQAGSGGRVTELTARPLLNLFYPELSGVVQPLSGEYGGRRTSLEQLSFFSGYGVETGLLIDLFEMFGLSAIAQIDLQERIHHNQPLEALSKMSFAIIQAVIRKLERRYGREMLEDVNRTMKLIRYGHDRFFLDVEEIAEQERPPMVDLPEYHSRTKATGQ